MSLKELSTKNILERKKKFGLNVSETFSKRTHGLAPTRGRLYRYGN